MRTITIRKITLPKAIGFNNIIIGQKLNTKQALRELKFILLIISQLLHVPNTAGVDFIV